MGSDRVFLLLNLYAREQWLSDRALVFYVAYSCIKFKAIGQLVMEIKDIRGTNTVWVLI